MDYYTSTMNSGNIYWDTCFVPGKSQVLGDEGTQTNTPEATRGTKSGNRVEGKAARAQPSLKLCGIRRAAKNRRVKCSFHDSSEPGNRCRTQIFTAPIFLAIFLSPVKSDIKLSFC